ncbi:MobA/MobL family protein [Gluconobacter oxydans]|uniref:MobA/MobL family protein n=1 Tax=Gluconobacter oxydans TaxID=442 RepID=UPI0003FA752B|nr:MobA/MobL family protein [Gluconobacter oxydans]
MSRSLNPSEIFSLTREAAIRRTIARVWKKEQHDAQKLTNDLLSGISNHGHRTGILGTILKKALESQGRQVKNLPSIRLKAPDTGGRPFHFSHRFVNQTNAKPYAYKKSEEGSKKDRKGANGSGGSAGKSGPGAKGGSRKTGKDVESAFGEESTLDKHQRYIERDTALQEGRSIDFKMLDEGRYYPAPITGELRLITPEDLEKLEAQAAQGQDQNLSNNGNGPDITDMQNQDLENDGEPDLSHTQNQDQEHGHTGSREITIYETGPDGKKRKAKKSVAKWVADNMDKSDRIPGENASAAAMQAYIENASKIDPANQTTGTTNSFGTIGATPEERAEFWRLTEEAAPKNGRLQNRMTLELPHEANDRSRFLIMRDFAKEFEDAGIPYWVAIHKPTKDNDSRNYHAHIVYGPRPAKKIINPKTGKLEWDFSIVETYISKCNHQRTRRPYKQTKPDKIYDIHNVKNQRIKFSKIVNRVMTEDQSDVRYDPRSYKDMGLDVAPMKNVRRIIADKSKSAKFAVMDSEWTRRMISQEIAAAAERRDASWAKIQNVKHAIRGATEGYYGIQKHKNRLPQSIRLSGHEIFSVEKSRLVMMEGRKIERGKLARRLMNEATLRALTSIIKATDTKRAPGSRKPMKSLDPDINIEDLDRLHAAARYELALHRARMKEDERKEKRRDRSFSARWRDAARSYLDDIDTTEEDSRPRPDLGDHRENDTPAPSSLKNSPSCSSVSFPNAADENSEKKGKKERQGRSTGINPKYDRNRHDHITAVTPGMQKSMDRMTDDYLSGIGDPTGLAHQTLQEKLRARARATRAMMDITLAAREKMRKRDEPERLAARAARVQKQEKERQKSALLNESKSRTSDDEAPEAAEKTREASETVSLPDQETGHEDRHSTDEERARVEADTEKKKKALRRKQLIRSQRNRSMDM